CAGPAGSHDRRSARRAPRRLRDRPGVPSDRSHHPRAAPWGDLLRGLTEARPSIATLEYRWIRRRRWPRWTSASPHANRGRRSALAAWTRLDCSTSAWISASRSRTSISSTYSFMSMTPLVPEGVEQAVDVSVKKLAGANGRDMAHCGDGHACYREAAERR